MRGRAVFAPVRSCDRSRAIAAHRQQNRIDTIMDVQIGLALVPIAQHMQTRGVRQQLLIEIENMPVRITLSQDGDKPENPSPHGPARRSAP